MNNLKKTASMFMIVAFTVTMVMAPFTPMARDSPQVTTPQISTPEQVMMDLNRYFQERSLEGPLDSVLSSYKATGIIPSDVALNVDGALGALITLEEGADIAAFEEIVKVNWKVDLGVATIVSAYIDGVAGVTAVEEFDGVVTAFADRLYNQKTSGVESKPTFEPVTTEPDAYVINPYIGADYAWAQGYTGDGVRVGVVDTGVDFTHPDLVGALDMGADNMSTSFDPTGYGFGVNLYRVNATVVNATEYLALSGWNMLSYEMGGKWYVNWSTCAHGSPYVNNQGGLSNLDWFMDAYLAAWYGNAYPGQANLTNYYNTKFRADTEIPAPQYASGGPTSAYTLGSPYYTVGYVFQQRSNPYLKVFAPALVLNGSKIIINWNDTRAHTDLWNNVIYWEQWDFDDPAAWAYYDALLDNSFVDDFEAGLWYGHDPDPVHSLLYYDYPDGERFGLGTLAHVWEDNIFGLGLIDGIGLAGRALGIMYDGNGHGTFCAGEIAGQGVTSFPVGLNYSMQTLKGVAPDAKVLGVMTVGIASEFMSMLWTAGFDFNWGTGYFEWNYDSAHQMHITSNSWGWVAPQYYELWGQYSLIYAAIGTPGYFNATYYPGVLQCFSAGNAGPGYGTTTPPRAPQLIGVGATTSYHTFQNSYGPDQGFDQIASFSARGPLTLGYPKPDILAPGANNYGIVLYHGDIFFGTSTGYATYGGTSMACPIVAGAAALVIEAAGVFMPDKVKTVLQSTADDIGMDPLAQGNGRVNITAAIDFVDGAAGTLWWSYDSVANWAYETNDAWEYRMMPYDRMNFMNDSIPTLFGDTNLYYGILAPGATKSLTFHGELAGGAPVSAGTYTWQATRYVVDDIWSFTYETSIYNETTSTGNPVMRAGWFELDTELEAVETGAYAAFAASTYATIHISGDYATFQGDNLWAFVFDWDDTSPANGVVDYYNRFTGLGDEITRWQYGGGTANNIKMDLSHPDGLGTLFPNEGIVMVNDQTIRSWPYTDGNNVTVTIVTWAEVVDTQITLGDNAAGGIWANLTVAADYGVHQGFIKVTDGAEVVHKIPYTFGVMAEYDAHDGSVMQIANGFGTDLTPYDPAFINAGWDTYYDGSDHGSYIVDVVDANVAYLGARADWTGAHTDVTVAIVDMTGASLADSADAVGSIGSSSVAIAHIPGPGRYIIYTTVNSVEALPEGFIVEVFGLDVLPEPTLEMTYHARDVPTTPLIAGGSAVGDHVVVNATWVDPVGGIPELTVTSVEMKVLYGTLFVGIGDLVIAPGDPGSQFTGTIDPAFYAWETVPGITNGDNVRVVCDFSNSDSDIMAWWSDTPMDQRSYGNNLLGAQMATGAHPEVGSFTASRDGDIDFGILNYDGAAGTYELRVDNRLGLEPDRVYANNFQIDTYYLLANQTYSVLVDSDTGVNIHYSVEFADIFIGNFFAPEVTVNDPAPVTGDEDRTFDISWSVTDRNADDTHYYSLWLSNDDGASYMLLAQNLTATTYRWNSSGWMEDSYMFRVRAYSLDFTIPDLADVSDPPAGYWPGDFADGFSTAVDAGDIPVTTPPPTTTTTTETTTTTTTTTSETTTTTTTTPPGLDPLLIGLVGGIGVGVVVILILFLIRKK
ncbi:hypothetical protein EU527_04690 [Candidatus Thorarchaeota archaeon]|nr:MAG: hypothetical protein EU527_04690 [Candidatus Thorarchaeota archaeon]